MRIRLFSIFCLACFMAVGGCQSHQPVAPPLSASVAKGMAIDEVHATCFPPATWTQRQVPPSYLATRQVWFSPSGDTSYGVICFPMPIPAGTDLAFWGFLAAMKKREGRADVVEKFKDESADALRFVATMPQYQLQGKLIVHGYRGWVFFASTLQGKPVQPDELDQAKLAREATMPIVK